MSLYQVQRIIGKKYNQDKRRFQYQIKWIGYPVQQSTWQPLKNLSFIKDLILHYDNNQLSGNQRPVGSNLQPQQQIFKDVPIERNNQRKNKMIKKVTKVGAEQDGRGQNKVKIKRGRGRPPKRARSLSVVDRQEETYKMNRNKMAVQSDSEQEKDEQSLEPAEISASPSIKVQKKRLGRPKKNKSPKKDTSKKMAKDSQSQKISDQQKNDMVESLNEKSKSQNEQPSAQSQEDKQFVVLQLSRKGKDFLFLVDDHNYIRWATRAELIREHPISLIDFYERNMWIQKHNKDGTINEMHINEFNSSTAEVM